jgi:hypothetical protein
VGADVAVMLAPGRSVADAQDGAGGGVVRGWLVMV